MEWFLARWRISYQIAMLGLVGLAGVLTIAGVEHWGGSRVDAAYATISATRKARDLETKVQIILLQARRSEKDFLLRHDEGSVTLQAASTADALLWLEALGAHLSDQADLRATAVQLMADIRQYITAFETVVRLARTVGLREDQGLLGTLRAAVHDVEEKLKSVAAPEAQIAMLMMRRHEKDFMARVDPKYATDVKARMPGFIAAINAAAAPDDLKRDLLAKMAVYQETFASFAAGTMETLQGVARLSAIHAEIEPRLAQADSRFVTQAEQTERQASGIAAATRRNVLVSLSATIVVMVGLCWLIGRGIARPIIAVTRAMDGLVRGDLTTAVPPNRRRDEIGTMVTIVGVLKQSLIDADLMRHQQAAERERADADKKSALTAMADRIEAETGAAVGHIGEQTARMAATVAEMRGLAGRTGLSAQGAATAAQLALGNAQTVAGAAEQLTASIQEISGQVSHSTVVVALAVQAGNDTRTTIEMLNERVGRIGTVAEIIGAIAAKTNLLALNATIEAARAGDAGKGFAVVASEVKQLASQTARSTEEITRHVTGVRAATTAAVEAVQRIAETIATVDAIATSIAAAVEQQGAATAEIARGVSGTAAAVNDMRDRNADFSREAEQAGRYADDVLADTTALKASVGDLRVTMIRTVRSSAAEVDRRLVRRTKMDLPCRLEIAGAAASVASVADLSEGGARIVTKDHVPPGLRGMLCIEALNQPLPCVVIGSQDGFTSVSFALDDAGRIAVRSFVERSEFAAAA